MSVSVHVSPHTLMSDGFVLSCVTHRHPFHSLFTHPSSQECVYLCVSMHFILFYKGSIRVRRITPTQPPPSILIPHKQPWDFKHGARPACDWENGPTGGFSGQGSPPPLFSPWLGGWHMAAQAGTPLVWHTHIHTERHTEGLEPPRLGPRSPWETWCHQASDRGGVLCMFVCVWSHLESNPPPHSWERRPLPATTSPWWLRCCLCSSKLERFTSACTHNTCTHTEPTGGRPCSAQQAHFKG